MAGRRDRKRRQRARLLAEAREVAREYRRGSSLRKIKKSFKVSHETARNLVRLDALPQELKRWYRAGRISMKAAIRVAKPKSTQKRSVLQKLEAGETVSRKMVDPNLACVTLSGGGLPEDVRVEVFEKYVTVHLRLGIGKRQKKKLETCPGMFRKRAWDRIAGRIADGWKQLALT